MTASACGAGVDDADAAPASSAAPRTRPAESRLVEVERTATASVDADAFATDVRRYFDSSVLIDVAEDHDMTVDELIGAFLDQIAVYDGDTLVITGAGEHDDDGETMTPIGGAGVVIADAVYGELKMPARVREHIATTRALDGQQTDEWDGYQARWTYHPDDGLQITIWEA